MQTKLQQSFTHRHSCSHRYHSKQHLSVQTSQLVIIKAPPFSAGACSPLLAGGTEHTQTHTHAVPVDTGALDAQQNAQVDTGPARIRLTAVTALVVPRDALHSLQDGLSLHTAIPGVGGRIDAASRGGRSPVQSLQGEKSSEILQSTVERTRALHSRGTDGKHYPKGIKLGLAQEEKGKRLIISVTVTKWCCTPSLLWESRQQADHCQANCLACTCPSQGASSSLGNINPE